VTVWALREAAGRPGRARAGAGADARRRRGKENSMSEMLSHCGLLCHECGAYQATMANDDAKRAEVAEEWSKMYDAEIKPSDINCTGCLTDGPNLFSHTKACEIRKCARERGVPNCAHCEDYGCETVAGLFKMAPEAKARLDEVKAGL